MPTPLELFIEALQKRHTCEEPLLQKSFSHTLEGFQALEAEMKCEFTLSEREDGVSPNTPQLHTHTSEGCSVPMADLKCETKCEDPFTLPEPPLHPGWLVVCRDAQGLLRGGCDERGAGTVAGCEWNGTGWTIHLLNGTTIPLRSVTSVGKTDAAGKVIAAWEVKRHGYDGEEAK